MSKFSRFPLSDLVLEGRAKPLSLADERVWNLNLDQIEPGVGRVIEKVVVDPKHLGPSTYPFEAGTVLYSKLRPYLNKVVVADGDGYATTELVPLRCNPDRVDPLYLAHFLRSAEFVAFASNVVAGAKMPRMVMSEFWKYKAPLPPLPEQRRISAILDQAEALRAKRRAALAKLDTLAQSIFVEMFGKPSDNPMGWPESRLVDVCSPKQWPTITTAELTQDGYPVFGANGLIGCYSTYNHEEPTVLITCRGATCGTINVCPPKCYVTGNAMALDSPDPGRVVIEYLEWVLRLRGMADTISGSAQPQITRQGLSPVRIPIPPLERQRLFSKRLGYLQNLERAYQASLDLSAALFQSLQHRAFRGEL